MATLSRFGAWRFSVRVEKWVKDYIADGGTNATKENQNKFKKGKIKEIDGFNSLASDIASSFKMNLNEAEKLIIEGFRLA